MLNVSEGKFEESEARFLFCQQFLECESEYGWNMRARAPGSIAKMLSLLQGRGSLSASSGEGKKSASASVHECEEVLRTQLAHDSDAVREEARARLIEQCREVANRK
ncbi:unnamed protein product, partial [Amoebophrya sp. A25]|eukprot:GSA25T00027695001.1